MFEGRECNLDFEWGFTEVEENVVYGDAMFGVSRLGVFAHTEASEVSKGEDGSVK